MYCKQLNISLLVRSPPTLLSISLFLVDVIQIGDPTAKVSNAKAKVNKNSLPMGDYM